MARLPRLDLAGVPQHVVQRGNNRQPCFLDDEDRQLYLSLLREGLCRYECSLHAYVLMSNHTHLLLTPAGAGNVSRLMQNVGRAYVQCFNGRHARTGTLWEGRFKSCLVDSEQYVLRCYRYIELNPVRAWMVEDPAAHPWSSFGGNAGHRLDPLLDPHVAYLALATEPRQRAEAYRALIREALSEEQLTDIRAYLQQQRALGTPAFRRRVEQQLQRYVSVRPAHRPPSCAPSS
jgi:putative transposase